MGTAQKTKQTLPERACASPYCGARFATNCKLTHGNRRYCSTKCRDRRHHIDRAGPYPDGFLDEIACDNCGKSIKRTRMRRRFCSDACRIGWRKDMIAKACALLKQHERTQTAA